MWITLYYSQSRLIDIVIKFTQATHPQASARWGCQNPHYLVPVSSSPIREFSLIHDPIQPKNGLVAEGIVRNGIEGIESIIFGPNLPNMASRTLSYQEQVNSEPSRPFQYDHQEYEGDGEHL